VQPEGVLIVRQYMRPWGRYNWAPTCRFYAPSRPALQPKWRLSFSTRQRAQSFWSGLLPFIKACVPWKNQTPHHPIAAATIERVPSPASEIRLQRIVMAQVKAEVRRLQQMLGLVGGIDKDLNGAIFICIDCEAYERAQHMITEIGISILDPKALKDIDPGPDGSAWFDAIKHVHLRVEEYKHLVNGAFVKGCPDKFNFGATSFIKLADAGKILHRIFNNTERVHEACNLDLELQPNTKAKIVLVGHALGGDTKYLRRVGFSPSNVIAHMDTQKLARASKKDSPGLRRLLIALGIEAQNLHNAGNDAAYTMQALVGLAVREHHEAGSVEATLAANKEVQVAARKSRKAQRKR